MFVGMTLAEVAQEAPPLFNGGYSVFVLQNENDTTGKRVDDSYSVRAILKSHPHLADYKVKLENNFYHTTVLRVIKE